MNLSLCSDFPHLVVESVDELEPEVPQLSGGCEELAQGVGEDVSANAVQQIQLLVEIFADCPATEEPTCNIGKLFCERSKTGRKEVMAENLAKKLLVKMKITKKKYIFLPK